MMKGNRESKWMRISYVHEQQAPDPVVCRLHHPTTTLLAKPAPTDRKPSPRDGEASLNRLNENPCDTTHSPKSISNGPIRIRQSDTDANPEL